MVVSKGSTPLQALGYYIPFITSFINNMRKIEREMIQAIIDRRCFSKANTRVVLHAGDPSKGEDRKDMRVYLHGNEIAKYYYNKDNTPLYINHCGWKTNTTKSRLNALIQHLEGGLSGIYQKNFEWIVKRVDNGDGSVHEYPMPDAWLLV